MNIKYVIKISIKKIFREKRKSLTYTALLTICLSMMFLFYSVANDFNYIIDENINNSGIRNIMLRVRTDIEILEETEYIDELFEIKGIQDVKAVDSFCKTNRIEILIDSYKNIENIVRDIENKNRYQIYIDVDILKKIPFVNILKLTSNIMFVLITIISFFILFLINLKSLNESENVISIYKAIGYKNLELKKMLLFESFFLGTIGYIFAAIISNGMMHFFINPLLSEKFSELLLGMDFRIGIKTYFMSAIAMIIIIILTLELISIKLKSVSSILLLKE
jgi:ABC-type antimicrobial peptide transport system permease subunit